MRYRFFFPIPITLIMDTYKNSFPGGPYGKVRDSWMYRWEHGVGSFQLDDDNCECDSLLSAGHAMCHSGFLLPNNNPSGIEDQFGVGLMNENVCTPAATSPNPSNSLYMYYKGMYSLINVWMVCFSHKTLCVIGY